MWWIFSAAAKWSSNLWCLLPKCYLLWFLHRLFCFCSFLALSLFLKNLQLYLFCCLLYRLNTEIQPKQKLGKWKPFASEQKPSNRNWLFLFTALLPILMCCDNSNQNSCNLNKFVLWRTLFIIYSSFFLLLYKSYCFSPPTLESAQLFLWHMELMEARGWAALSSFLTFIVESCSVATLFGTPC